MPIGWQIIIRRRDNAILAPGVQARRACAAAITRVARGTPLLCFNISGGHGHLHTAGSRALAGELARRIQLSLGHVLGHRGQLEPARLRPVHDQAHQRHLFRYILDQRRHHDLRPDPCHEASALPDLLGLRVNGAWMRAEVAEHLPSVHADHLASLFGITPSATRAPRLAALADAAAAAIGAASLAVRGRLVNGARTAAIHLASPIFGSRRVAAHLGCSRRAVQRALRRPNDRVLEHAVWHQWLLRSELLDRRAVALAPHATTAPFAGDAAHAATAPSADTDVAAEAGDLPVSASPPGRLRG